jgi:hypothetical protein
MNTCCTCEKDILALRLFEDNWRTDASGLQHDVTCVGSCIVTAIFCVSNCIELQPSISILIWVVWLFSHPLLQSWKNSKFVSSAESGWRVGGSSGQVSRPITHKFASRLRFLETSLYTFNYKVNVYTDLMATLGRLHWVDLFMLMLFHNALSTAEVVKSTVSWWWWW